MTAAHCVFGLNVENFVIVLGLHYLNDSLTQHPTSLIVKVSKIILHQDYNHKDPNYDIALIKLKTKVKMTKQISTICLPESESLTDSILNEYAIVAGWGRDPDANVQTNHYRKLQQTFLKIINGEQLCSKHLQTFDYSNLYCAYDSNIVKNSNVCKFIIIIKMIKICQILFLIIKKGIGDSGGPLMIKQLYNSKFYVYGIVSFVFTFIDTDNRWKCYTQAPSYFTKVTKYIDWLSRNLNED